MIQKPQPSGYTSVPLTGVIDEQVQLVHASPESNVVQIMSATVGILGGAILGAALGPILTGDTNAPTEALLGVSKACVETVARCQELVSLPVRRGSLANSMAGVGLVLIGMQFLLVLVRVWPRRSRKPAAATSTTQQP